MKKNLMTVGSTILVLAVVFGPYATALAGEVEVEVSITPERLKLDKGKQGNPWVTCHVTLPEGYDAEDVTKDNTLLEDCLIPVLVGECTEDPQIVAIHFNKEKVRVYLEENGLAGTVKLTITITVDGDVLEGSDTIKVN